MENALGEIAEHAGRGGAVLGLHAGADGIAALAGCVSVAGGLFSSARIDTPAGPSIVVVATALFFLTLVGRRPAAG
jgi:ABC-type Mn2+/Zn2+ transport system permease subunit